MKPPKVGKIRFSPEMGVMAFVLLPVVLLVLLLRPDEQPRLPPRRAREVLEPHSREYYLANLNYIIRSHQEQPFNMWPDVLSELYGIDHRLRVYYYREGIYLIADPVERTNKHHFAESAGLATVLQETAPGYQGLVLLCARENLEHCILHGKGKVPWLTKKERATLKSMAKFYRMAPRYDSTHARVRNEEFSAFESKLKGTSQCVFPTSSLSVWLCAPISSKSLNTKNRPITHQ